MNIFFYLACCSYTCRWFTAKDAWRVTVFVNWQFETIILTGRVNYPDGSCWERWVVEPNITTDRLPWNRLMQRSWLLRDCTRLMPCWWNNESIHFNLVRDHLQGRNQLIISSVFNGHVFSMICNPKSSIVHQKKQCRRWPFHELRSAKVAWYISQLIRQLWYMCHIIGIGSSVNSLEKGYTMWSEIALPNGHDQESIILQFCLLHWELCFHVKEADNSGTLYIWN